MEKRFKEREWLYTSYVVEFRSTTDIAKEFAVKPSTINYWLKKFDIPLRTKSEALSGKHNPNWGKQTAEQTKEKISKSCRGKKHTIETRKKISASHKGKGKAKNHKEKIALKAKERFKDKENHPRFGKENKWGRHTEEAKNKISKRMSGENNPMFGAIGSLNPMFGKRGKEHPAWKENKITDLYTQIRGLPEYIQWRLSVFKRDGFTCKDCGNNKPLEAEHKFPFALLILENKIGTIEQAILCEKLWDTNNGITLCKNCHKNTKTYGVRVSELILLFSK